MESTGLKKVPTRAERRSAYYGMSDEQLAKSGLRMEITDVTLVLRDVGGDSLFECPLRQMFNRRWMRYHYGWIEGRKILRLLKTASRHITLRTRKDIENDL